MIKQTPITIPRTAAIICLALTTHNDVSRLDSYQP